MFTTISIVVALLSALIAGGIGVLIVLDMNSSASATLLECQTAKEVAENRWICVIMIAEILGSCLILLQLYRCVMLVKEKHIPLHDNLRLLMTCALICYIYTCLTSFAFPVFYLYRRGRHVQPCDYMYEKVYCYSLRWPVYYGIVFQSCLHLAISLERALATKYMHTYAQGFLWWGRVIAVGAISSTAFMASYILKPDGSSTNYFPFCNITNPTTANRMKVALGVMLTIDGLAVITDLTVYTINYRTKQDRMRIAPKIYTLTWSYQLAENNCSTTIVIPVTVSQSVCYVIYIVSSLVVRHVVGDEPTVLFYGLTNFCFMFFQLSLLMATVAFYRKYLMNYNNQINRRTTMKEPQSSQDYFKYLEQQLDDAFRRRKESLNNTLPKGFGQREQQYSNSQRVLRSSRIECALPDGEDTMVLELQRREIQYSINEEH